MAVQADDPPNSPLGPLNNRYVQLPSIDLLGTAEPRSFLLPFSHQSFDAYQQVFSRTAPAAALNSSPLPMMPNIATFQQQTAPFTVPNANVTAQQSKKRKASSQRQSPSQPQKPTTNATAFNRLDINRTHGSASASPLSGVVSTGLRLAFDDDRSTVTSSRLDTGSACINNELSMQLLHQQHELRQLLKIQIEQLHQALKERLHLHSKVLLASVEEEMSRRLQDKEAELGRLKKQNNELEERVKHFSLEINVWQSKARSYEAMAAVLRTNLQQAIMHQSREKSKLEGCGDSEADDAASVHIDNNVDAQQTRAMMMRTRKAGLHTEFLRACKRCRTREVTMLLLPCMHLCLCNDCSVYAERCPICSCSKSASVEVYLS